MPLADTAPAMLKQKIDASVAKQADTVEVVYTDGNYSHLEYGTSSPKRAEPYRSTGPLHCMESPRLVPFGSCRPVRGKIRKRTGRHCGLILDLSIGKTPLDLLGFEEVRLSGTVTGRWSVALSDEYLAGIEENRIIGKLDTDGTTTFQLSRAASQLDLKRSKLLVFILESPVGSMTLDRVEFAATKKAPVPVGRPAIWMWDNRPAKTNPVQVASDLAQKQVRRVYLQINDTLEPLAPFLRECRSRNIEVYALDGSPEYLEHPDPLLARARMVSDFNASTPDAPFAGFQIDVEPHLRKDFRFRLERYGHRYQELLDRLKEELGNGIPLSTVIPFWYDSLLLDGRSLAWHLISRSSEAVIMSYRTTIGEVESISRDELEYGERMGRPILLGIETTRIPDELHVCYRRCPLDTPQAVVSDGTGWCRTNDYTVPGSRLSFYGREQAFRDQLNRTVNSPAFAGWVIHSYESYPH